MKIGFVNLCNTTSSGTFLHMFWECPVVISLWTHVNLVLSSLLWIDWSVNPSLCLLNDDSDLCISSMQKRMLFAGFTAVKKTIIQNWFTPHMCRKTYWIRSLLQIVTCECTTARVGGARPSTIDAWQCFFFDIRDCIKEWLVCSCCPSLSPSLLIGPWCWVCICCFVLFYFGCCVVLCVKKNIYIWISIWRWILVTQPKNNKISTSADVDIGHQFNIDIRRWIYIEFWLSNVATKI